MGTTVSSRSPQRHLVLFNYEAWGHMRPMCNFAARIVKMQPTILITHFVTPTFYDRVQTELRRNFEDQESSLLERIRIIALPCDNTNPLDSSALQNAFANAYEKLVNLQPVSCVKTEAEIKTTCCPDLVVVDFFGSAPIDAVRKASKKQVKVLFWFAGSATSLFCVGGPESQGGKGNLRTRSQEVAKRTCISIEEAAAQITLTGKGSLVRLPGLPPMYDYEIQPQRVSFSCTRVWDRDTHFDSVADRSTCVAGTMEACDGIVLATPECYETEAIAALRDWLAGSSRLIYACGPLIPSGVQAVAYEKLQSSDAAKVESFLHAKLASHGEHSVLYISFGTIFFPLEPEKLAAFLEIAVEKKVPFILNHTSPYIPLPDFVTDKLSSYSDCMVTKWCPQQLVLSHSATGYFVSHAGHNSVIEAITEGV
ncbi:uncharacterized protein C8Q71DRAFT_719010, partial [Rhodofomes roseus]